MYNIFARNLAPLPIGAGAQSYLQETGKEFPVKKIRIGKKLALLLRALPKIIEAALKERFREVDEWEFYHVASRAEAPPEYREPLADNATEEEVDEWHMRQNDWRFDDYLCTASISYNGHIQVRGKIEIEEWFAIGYDPIVNATLWICLPDGTQIRKAFRYDERTSHLAEENDEKIPESPPEEIPFDKSKSAA